MPDPCLSSSPRIQLDLVPQGGVDALTADVVLSANADQGITLEADGLWAPRGPIVVGSLPQSPTDGMERYLQAGDSLWHVRRYSNVWYVVGGSYLLSVDPASDAGATAASDGNWHLHAGGPSLTAPYAGSYTVEWGAHMNPAAVGATARVGFSINAADPGTDRWSAFTAPSGSGVSGTGVASVSRLWGPINLAANDVIKLASLGSAGGGSVVATHRFLKLYARTLS